MSPKLVTRQTECLRSLSGTGATVHLHLAATGLVKSQSIMATSKTAFILLSELKAIRQVVTTSLERDEEALSLFLRHGYIPAPWSIYRDIRKLEPGRHSKFSSAAPADWHSKTFWFGGELSIADARQTPLPAPLTRLRTK